MSSNNGNKYTHIQSFGTASAFDPARIQRSNMAAQSQPASPFRLIDVNVNLVGTTAGQVLVLGAALPTGCVIHSGSVNGNSSLTTGTTFDVSIYTPALNPALTPTIPLAVPVSAFTAVGTLPATAANVNTGLVNPAVGMTIPALPSPRVVLPASGAGFTGVLPAYPVLVVVGVPGTGNVGNVRVKLVIFCP